MTDTNLIGNGVFVDRYDGLKRRVIIDYAEYHALQTKAAIGENLSKLQATQSVIQPHVIQMDKELATEAIAMLNRLITIATNNYTCDSSPSWKRHTIREVVKDYPITAKLLEAENGKSN